MTFKPLIISLFLITIVAVVFALSDKPHTFSSAECNRCHVDVENTPMDIKREITSACNTCHSELKNFRSHPTDIYPVTSIPSDLPLRDGKLTCLTCHYVHYDRTKQSLGNRYFLRRPYSGAFFCSSCHKMDAKKHIVFENVHTGVYRETSRQTRIDEMSLTCIGCHDAYISEQVQFLGSGVWLHTDKKKNHPVGISYKKISSKNIRDFRPAMLLSGEITLFDGKIGCGTCHNLYSKEKFKLVMNNRNSTLCFSCHIK